MKSLKDYLEAARGIESQGLQKSYSLRAYGPALNWTVRWTTAQVNGVNRRRSSLGCTQPNQDVCGIVAEDITGRFLNVINLFNGAVPLIAIQMRTYESVEPNDDFCGDSEPDRARLCE
jgi:hypothetical protein